MGIPLAGGTNGGPDAEGADDGPRVDALDFDGEFGDVADGLEPVDYGVYETSGEVGFSLLVENTGTRTFERVEVRVDVESAGAESVTANGAELGHLAPGDRWRFWVPLARDAVETSDAAPRYTVDVEAA